MKRTTIRLVGIFLIYTCIFALAKVLFLCVHGRPEWGASEWLAAIWHGLPMDMTVAGYFSVIPGLLLVVSEWFEGAMRAALKVYFVIAAALIAAIVVVDATLYGYWGFRLDSTPLFYFMSSPTAALASAQWWHYVLGVLGFAAIGCGVYFATASALKGASGHTERPIRGAVCTFVLTGLLFFPIRGGVTVSTMNLSRSYFSSDTRLNHAAVNPAFSLLYSLTHSDDFGSQYRFMASEEAEAALSALNAPVPTDSAATAEIALTTDRPDIYLIILESFSAHLLPSMGGEPIARQLDSIASTGLLFTDIYASSFRTDRALPAILNAFPAQPSSSLMKYVEKAEKLPSLSGALKAAGYQASYYYGGDINFTNMKALLVAGGYDPIVCDADFTLADKAGKWGAHDGALAQRVAADAAATPEDAVPQLRVVQTSSSHEPFGVPYSNAAFADEPAKNAFAYADSCLGAMVRGIEASPRGRRTLFVIVPDHLGAWPLGLDDALERHRVPLVISGPALASEPRRISTLGGQPDIAPTILELLGLPTTDFPWGHSLRDGSAPRYAFFSEPGIAALVTPTDTVVLECDADRVAVSPRDPSTLTAAKAYLQSLYDALSRN